MCWNEKVSWATFIIGTILNILLVVIKKDKKYSLLALLFQSIITVQLGEALIWRDPDGNVGKIGSYISFYSVFLQAFIAMLFIYFSLGFNSVYTKIALVLVVIYTICGIYYIPKLNIRSKPGKCCEGDTRDHIIAGGWNESGYLGTFYGIFAIYFIFLLPIISKSFTLLALYLFVSMILTWVIYKKSFASLWCWFAAFLPVIALMN